MYSFVEFVKFVEFVRRRSSRPCHWPLGQLGYWQAELARDQRDGQASDQVGFGVESHWEAAAVRCQGIEAQELGQACWMWNSPEGNSTAAAPGLGTVGDCNIAAVHRRLAETGQHEWLALGSETRVFRPRDETGAKVGGSVFPSGTHWTLGRAFVDGMVVGRPEVLERERVTLYPLQRYSSWDEVGE